MQKRREIKRNYLKELKKQPCSHCNKNFPPEAMDFNHIRGTKLGNVGDLSLNHIPKEITKCEILCATCHRLVTAKERLQKRLTPRPNTKECFICGCFYAQLRKGICVWCTPASLEKKRFILEIKKNPCVDCKETFPPEALDFDHITGEKTAGIADLLARRAPMERLKEEVSKCVIRCATCHRIKTMQDRRNKGIEKNSCV